MNNNRNIDTFVGLSLVFVFIFFNCTNHHPSDTASNVPEQSESISEIDLAQCVEQKIDTLYLSDYVDSLEFIPLETSDSLFLRKIMDVYLIDSQIVVGSAKRIDRFSRSGRYLNQIAGCGRGPREFNGMKNIAIDWRDTTLYILQNWRRNWLHFTLDNTFLERTKPLYSNAVLSNVFPISDSLFVLVGAYVRHPEYLNKSFVLALGNKKGHLYERIPLPFTVLKDSTKWSSYYYPGSFFPSFYNRQLICYGYGCDTIYGVSDEGIQPRFSLDMERYQPSLDVKYHNYESRSEGSQLWKEKEKYIFINDIPFETNHHVFLEFRYNGKYYFSAIDKYTGSSKTSLAPRSQKGPVKFGLKDDMAGGCLYWPDWSSYEGDKWIAAFDAFELIEHLPQIRKIQTPSARRLETIVMGLKENDNPVLVVAHLK